MANTKEIDLGYRPRKWQTKIHTNFRRWNVLIIHRRAGKTIVGIMQLINDALKTQKKNAQFAYTEPYLNQAKAVAWRYLKEYALKIPGTKSHETELWVEFPNNARIRLFGADHPDALRGQYFDGIVLDEFADMSPRLWGEIVLPALLDRKGWCMFTGTPKGVNLLSELHDKHVEDPEWNCAKMDCYQTEALSPEQIAVAKKEMTELQFRQEMLCDISGGTIDTLISHIDVKDAMKRVPPTDMEFSSSAKIIGVDVARQGDDFSTILRRQGPVVYPITAVNGETTMKVAQMVAYQIGTWEPDAVFIDGTGGYGAGVIDVLRDMGYHVFEVQFGSKANDARFRNKRTEMWWEMAQWLKRPNSVLPDDPDLAAELASVRYDIGGAKDVLALEPKDELKKRMRRSPDRADALALTFAMTVMAKNPFERFKEEAPVEEYDPFSRDRL